MRVSLFEVHHYTPPKVIVEVADFDKSTRLHES